MHNFKNLEIWKEAMILTKMIYTMTKLFPSEEKYGLTSQIRRCSVSIPSNIAEGSAKSSTEDFANFLNIAMGSSFELETQFILALDLGYMDSEHIEDVVILSQIQKVQKMIHGFKKSILPKEL